MIYRITVEVECEDDAAQPSYPLLMEEVEGALADSPMWDDFRVSLPQIVGRWGVKVR
jgi:hypothetical protein